eukprot:scaffold58345_cov62-Phaeocystis_antarctica.AAC.3
MRLADRGPATAPAVLWPGRRYGWGGAHLASARLSLTHDAELVVDEREHAPLGLLGLLLEGRALEEVDAQFSRHRRQLITLERKGRLLGQRLEVHGGHGSPHDASPRNVRPRHVLGTK